MKFMVERHALELKQLGSVLRCSITVGFRFDLSAKGGSRRVDFGKMLDIMFESLGTREGSLWIRAGAIKTTVLNNFGSSKAK